MLLRCRERKGIDKTCCPMYLFLSDCNEFKSVFASIIKLPLNAIRFSGIAGILLSFYYHEDTLVAKMNFSLSEDFFHFCWKHISIVNPFVRTDMRIGLSRLCAKLLSMRIQMPNLSENYKMK